MNKILRIFAVAALGVFASAAMAQDKYVKVTTEPTDWSGDYLIVYEEENVAFNGGLDDLDVASNTIQVVISENAIEANETTNAAKFTIAAVEGGYSVKAANGKYIGQTADKNGLRTSDKVIPNTISLDNNGNVLLSTKITNKDEINTLRFNKDNDQKRFRYYKSGQQPIQIYKFNGTTSSLSAPTISATETAFEEKSTVTITAADEGATIYYTTDGAEPTTTSTKYTTSFDVTATTTVKAIAVKDEETSSVASLSLNRIVVTNMTFAAAAAWCAEQDDTEKVTHNDYVRVTFENAKILYVNGNQIFVRQGDDAIQLYKFPTTEQAIATNDILNGTYVAQLLAYYSAPELEAVTNISSAANLTVTNSEAAAEPIAATVADVEARKYICNLVKITNVTLSQDDKYYWINSGSNDVEIANPQISANTSGLIPTEYDNKTYTVTAIVSGVYKGEGTITVISCEEAGTVAIGAPVFSFANDAYVSVGQKIIITAEEGATIFYTTDGSTPDGSSSPVYSEPIEVTDGLTTIKAIAIKGTDESAVATLNINVIKNYTLTEFRALADGVVGNVNFEGASIVYINESGNRRETYVVSKEGYGICIFEANKGEGLANFSAGTGLSGTVLLKKSIYNGKQEAVATEGTDWSKLEADGRGDNEPVVLTIANAQNADNGEKLVVISGVIKKDGDNYWLVENAEDEATDGIQLYDGFKLADYNAKETDANEKATIVGIFTYFNSTWEIQPIEPIEYQSTATAIGAVEASVIDLNAPIYNLQGQQVDKNAKGILIQNGKKFIVK